MDILAASQAIGIAKQLRDIDRAIDEVAFKARLVELQEMLLNAKSSLMEANEALLEKGMEIERLQRTIEELQSGDVCPICRNGSLKVTAVRAHPTLGEIGHQEQDLECSNPDCRHRERRNHVPKGAINI